MRFGLLLAVAIVFIAAAATADHKIEGPYYKVTCEGEEPVLVDHPSDASCLERCQDTGFHREPGAPCIGLDGREMAASVLAASGIEIEATEADIRAACRSQWPTNQTLQLTCVNSNIADRKRILKGLAAGQPPAVLESAKRCLRDWATPPKANFSLARSCINSEIEAYNALREKP